MRVISSSVSLTVEFGQNRRVSVMKASVLLLRNGKEFVREEPISLVTSNVHFRFLIYLGREQLTHRHKHVGSIGGTRVDPTFYVSGGCIVSEVHVCLIIRNIYYALET